jgi:hypothetical protein
MPTIETVNLERGLPTVDEARQRLRVELQRARERRAPALKLIHGYGSTGVGGKLKDALRVSLKNLRNKGEIAAFVAGDRWTISEPLAREILDRCPALGRDSDLNRYNDGITIVLL